MRMSSIYMAYFVGLSSISHHPSSLNLFGPGALAQRPMKPYGGYYNALQTLQTLQTLQAEDLFSGNQSKTPIARNRANELPKKKLSTSSPGT